MGANLAQGRVAVRREHHAAAGCEGDEHVSSNYELASRQADSAQSYPKNTNPMGSRIILVMALGPSTLLQEQDV